MYVTFLPYALERRVSGEDWVVDAGSTLFQWFCYSANQASFALSGSNFATRKKKKKKNSIPVRFFLGHCGTIGMASVQRGHFSGLR